MKDLIILGAGPAGITAAVYAARKRMDFTVISLDIGGQAAWSGDIENYTGYQYITGPELAQKFKEHLDKYEFDLREGVSVKKVEKQSDGFKVILSEGEALLTKTLVIASGKKPSLLGVPGEGKYKNKGLAYCATCDGPLFAGKNVAVIGGGNSALDAALQMTKIAAKVYLININKELAGDKIMREKVQTAKNVEILNETKTLEVLGDKFVNAVKVETKGQAREIPVSGIFVEIGLVPNTSFIDFVNKNEQQEIMINCKAETSDPAVFAAGDVTDVPEKQIIIAAGDGAKACLSAFRYL
ncbi:MAG: FAD-dependent oxidoreductase, partial [Candidatus Margulisbacteria bacterium]|nr:FAD-dependent oxidoreductase [Candidatus Margulisiibacteriota bacterium]